jgi:hypothetical protein
MALVEMSVVEQRYRAVLAVGRGEPKIMWWRSVRGVAPNPAHLVDPVCPKRSGRVDRPHSPTVLVCAPGSLRGRGQDVRAAPGTSRCGFEIRSLQEFMTARAAVCRWRRCNHRTAP